MSEDLNQTAAASVEIIPASAPSPGVWTPVVGSETMALMSHLGLAGEGRQRVLDEGVDILRRCVAPTGPSGTKTGLAIGYVQSGKTMSFTTVAALARDNGYRVVIVITGTSAPLFHQSTARLQRDLRLPTRPDRKWKFFENPSDTQATRGAIEGTLEDWIDPDVTEPERQTVLITVMKNHARLRNLITLLSHLSLGGVPALVIDDEADQAGLNAQVNKGMESATYRQLLRLRSSLPWHTYLQYTATPQAPLLISLIDALSPEFAAVLTPGDDYTGGKQFFVERKELVCTIPEIEIPGKGQPLGEPPDSLLEALRVFMLGVAAGLISGGNTGNRSMLVHPSQATAPHTEYTRVVRQVVAEWKKVLALPDADPDRQQLVKEFSEAYEDLKATASDIPSLDDLLKKLRRAITMTVIEEVNSKGGATPQINWKDTYSHILIGGQAMDRGFTVEGLTVTYMPRGLGVGNADTVQQRARFFGYKKPYLDYCRVYLSADARQAYTLYVEHEEDIRRRLTEHVGTGKRLWEWRRAFFITPALKPTRSNVLSLGQTRGGYSSDWFTIDRPHASDTAIADNRQVVDDFLSEIALRPADGHPDRTETQRHLLDDAVPLAQAYEQLLTRLRYPEDSQELTGLLLQIARYRDDERNVGAECVVYRMGPVTGNGERRRGVDADGAIINLFQGAYPVDPPEQRGSIYRGDREIRDPKRLTIQVHYLTVTEDGQEIATHVPTIAVWVPKEYGGDWLVQEAQNVPA